MITKEDNDLLDEFTDALYSFNDEDQDAFLEKLKEKIKNHKNDKDKSIKHSKGKKKYLAKKLDIICKSEKTDSKQIKNSSRVCPYCGSKYFIKNGLNNKDEQRFICKNKSCGKSFINRTGHLNYNNQIDESLWRLFLKDFINGLTNVQIANNTGLNETTIHYLKHKIMNMVMRMTRGYNLTGIVQADEYYARASFKGQRSIYKFRFNENDEYSVVKKIPDYEKFNYVMYDKSHKKERLRGLSKMQICYPTALSKDSLFCGKPAGRGIASLKKLENAYVNNLDNDIIYVTDKVGASNKFAIAHDLVHVSLKANKDSRKGEFHLQNINSFHAKLNKVNDSDRNYATKYSEEYMSWIAWNLKEKDKNIDEKIDILFDLVNIGETTPTIKNIKEIEFPEELRPFSLEEMEEPVIDFKSI